MKYFIAHLLTGDAKRYHERLTRELSTRFGIAALHDRVPPHLTIKMPFDATPERVADIERVVRSFAHTHAAVPLAFDGFGHFGFRTIYINTKGSDATRLARECIAVMRENFSSLPQARTEGNKLHASVARFLTRRQFRRVWQLVRPLLLSLPFSFDNIAILRQEGRVWHVHALVPLKTDKAVWYTRPAWMDTQRT